MVTLIILQRILPFLSFLVRHPQFLGLVLPSGQKKTIELLATIALEVVPFCAYAPVPVLLPFLNASWKFCDGVQHRMRFCLDHLNCVKMTALKFYLHSGKQRKVGWVEKTVVLLWVKNSLVKNEAWNGSLS
jgi:hypothetical protein